MFFLLARGRQLTQNVIREGYETKMVTKKTKLIHRNPFNHVTSVIPPWFIGRENELEEIKNCLVVGQSNFLISGQRGYGKSSIARTIYKEISDIGINILTLPMSIFHFYDDKLDQFLGDVIHEICATIWKNLLERDYSELIEDSLLYPTGKISEKKAKKLHRIYRIITSEKLSAKGTASRSTGAKLVAEASLAEAREVSYQRQPLKPFEFLHLLDELYEILSDLDYDRILVVVDEFNYVSDATNSEFYRRFFEVITSQKIQFGLVGAEFEKNETISFSDPFGTRIDASPFDIKLIKTLITEYMESFKKDMPIEFHQESYSYIHALTSGSPHLVQLLCFTTLNNAIKDNLKEINLNFIKRTATEMNNRVPCEVFNLT